MKISAVDLSPQDYATMKGISVLKPLLWIKTGELEAVNVATKAGGLPRWRISPAAIEAFEAARAAVPQAPVTRRPRRKAGHVVEYF